MVFVSASNLKRVPATLSPFGRVLLYSSCSLKPWLFSWCPRADESAHSPAVLFLSTVVPSVEGRGYLYYCVSASLAVLSVGSHLVVCRTCSLRPQFFFRRNCSINRGRFGISMEEVSSRFFLNVILDQNSGPAFIYP